MYFSPREAVWGVQLLPKSMLCMYNEKQTYQEIRKLNFWPDHSLPRVTQSRELNYNQKIVLGFLQDSLAITSSNYMITHFVQHCNNTGQTPSQLLIYFSFYITWRQLLCFIHHLITSFSAVPWWWNVLLGSEWDGQMHSPGQGWSALSSLVGEPFQGPPLPQQGLGWTSLASVSAAPSVSSADVNSFLKNDIVQPYSNLLFKKTYYGKFQIHKKRRE